MTVDATLAALTAGFAVYTAHERSWKLYLVLTLAALTRETGFLLVAAFCFWTLGQRDWRRTALFATAALPGLLWVGFVHLHTRPEVINTFTWIPLRSWVQAFLHPLSYRQSQLPVWILPMLDRVAMIGGLLAIAFSIRSRRGTVRVAALLFGGLAAWHGLPGTWLDCFGYTRSFGPLFLLLALERKPAPAGLTLIRTVVQLGGQFVMALDH